MDDIHDKTKLKRLNVWLGILVVSIILWTIGIFVYMEKRITSVIAKTIPLVLVNTSTGKIDSTLYSNMFPANMVSSNTNVLTNTIASHIFKERTEFDQYEMVIIKYFYIPALVMEKSNNKYILIYKDHNHILQPITLPIEMLLSPSSSDFVNPISLLVD